MSNTAPSETEMAQRESEAPPLPEPTILAVDTSSPRISLAMARGELVVAALAVESREPHSRTLFARLATLLEIARLGPDQIDVFAVATGPGSFTGLRVGLAAVKGLARTLGRRAVGVTSLDALAVAAGVAGQVVPMIDAGRGEVYGGLREVTAEGLPAVTGQDVVGPTSLVLAGIRARLRPGPVVFIGDGAAGYQAEIAGAALKAGTELRVVCAVEGSLRWQLKSDRPYLAPHIARLACRMLNSGSPLEAHPYYLRPSDAELKWRDEARVIPA